MASWTPKRPIWESYNYASVAVSFSCFVNNMKISNSKNLLKDFSPISYLNNDNISLIPCNSHKERLIWKYIHTPKFCFDCNIFCRNSLFTEIWHKYKQLCCSAHEFSLPISLLFFLRTFLFCHTIRPNFLML